MEQTLERQSDHPQAGHLLRLVTSYLQSPMGALTLHQSSSERPDILALLNMSGQMASHVAAAVHHEVRRGDMSAGNRGFIATDAVPRIEYLVEPKGWFARTTFISRVDPQVSLALSACRRESSPNGQDVQPSRSIEGWVDLHLRLLWEIRRAQNRTGLLGRALDQFDFGVLLLDRRGNILFMNERGQQLLDAGDGMRRAGGSVIATDFDDAVRLQTAIQHLCHDAGSAGPPGFGENRVMLLGRRQGRPLIAALVHISPAERDPDGSAILLCMVDPDRDAEAIVRALCRAHGLTATEASLVIHLVGGTTVEQAAQLMHVQTQTARAYLKQIFIKTGTHRQVDLVRLMLSAIIRIR